MNFFWLTTRKKSYSWMSEISSIAKQNVNFIWRAKVYLLNIYEKHFKSKFQLFSPIISYFFPSFISGRSRFAVLTLSASIKKNHFEFPLGNVPRVFPFEVHRPCKWNSFQLRNKITFHLKVWKGILKFLKTCEDSCMRERRMKIELGRVIQKINSTADLTFFHHF